MNGRCIFQNEQAQRWQVSESTLERWRSQRTGLMFLRLGGQVRYRITDVEAFETRAYGMASGQISDKMANKLRFRKLTMPKNAKQVRGSCGPLTIDAEKSPSKLGSDQVQSSLTWSSHTLPHD